MLYSKSLLAAIFLYFILFCCWCCFGHSACEILVLWPGAKPLPPEVEVPTLNHWTAREVRVTLHIPRCVCPSQAPDFSLSSVSLLVIISLFLISTNLFLFCKKVHLYLFKLDYTHEWHHVVLVFLCLTLVSVIISWSIQCCCKGHYPIHFYG